jgi:hypothetical protein
MHTHSTFSKTEDKQTTNTPELKNACLLPWGTLRSSAIWGLGYRMYGTLGCLRLPLSPLWLPLSLQGLTILSLDSQKNSGEMTDLWDAV